MNSGDENMETKITKSISIKFESLLDEFQSLINYYNNKSTPKLDSVSFEKKIEYLDQAMRYAELGKNITNQRKKISKFQLDFEECYKNDIGVDYALPDEKLVEIIGSDDLLVENKSDKSEDNNESELKLSENDQTAEGKTRKYAFTNPEYLIVLDKRMIVSNWTDVLIKVCETMITTKPSAVSEFDKSEVLKGRTRVYFSYDKEVLTSQAKQLSNGIYVETNFNSNEIVKVCGKILCECGLSINDMKFDLNFEKSEIVNTCENINCLSNSQKQDDRIVQFPQRYKGLRISWDLIERILNEIKTLWLNNNEYFEKKKLLLNLENEIALKSHYSQPHHVLGCVIDFLKDLDIVQLFEGVKRGKYVLADNEALYEMLESQELFVSYLNDIS